MTYLPSSNPLILKMYSFAYPDLEQTTLVQLIELEFEDFLSKMNTLCLAANNGFEPELVVEAKRKLNSWAEQHDPFKEWVEK